MDSKKYLGLVEAYQQVYEQQKIGVPLKDASDRAAREQLQKMIPKGDKVHDFGSKLQKAHYEPEGEDIHEIPLVVAAPLVAGGIGLAANAIGKGMNKFVDKHSKTKSSDYSQKQGLGANLAKQRERLQQNSYQPEGELVEDYQEFFNATVDFFVETNIFETLEEIDFFVNSLIQEDLCYTFLDDVLEFCYHSNIIEGYINEVSAGLLARGLKAAGGVFKTATPAVRGLSAKTLVKKGFTPGGLDKAGRMMSKINKPALDTQTQAIQSARAARKVGMPAAEKPGKYLELLKQKKASSPPAPTSSGKSFVQKGWERHTAAGGPDPSKLVQRGITDTTLATMILGMGQAAGLPVAKTLGMGSKAVGAPIVRSSQRIVRSAPKVEPNPWTQDITHTIKKASERITPKTAEVAKLPGAKVQQPAGLLAPAKTGKGTGLARRQSAPSSVSSTKIEPVTVKDLTPKASSKGLSGAKVQQPAGLLAPAKTPKAPGEPDFKHMIAPRLPRSGAKVSPKTPGGGKTGTGLSNKVKLAMAAGGLAAAVSSKKDGKDPSDSINKYNTMDPDGTVRDRLKVGPKIVGPKIVGPKIVGPGSSKSTSSSPSYTKTAPSSQTDKEEPKAQKPESTETKPTKKKEKLSSTVKDLMDMRAASLARQGKTKEAQEVRDEMEKRYSSK